VSPLTPVCERCGDPFVPTQETQRYCSRRCREAAKKRRSRLRPLAGKLLGMAGDTGDTSLTGAYERAMPPQRGDVRDDHFEQAVAHDGFDVLPGDRSYLAPYELEYEGRRRDVRAHQRLPEPGHRQPGKARPLVPVEAAR
jgi:predicted nucleic acid-binding Zn ribbon protein